MIKLNNYDKRPIAKFHRCWQEDIEAGIALDKCRGINCEQFRAADRLICNYLKIFMTGSWNLAEVKINKNHSHTHQLERQIQATRNHYRVLSQLNKKSKEIIEHFCLHESTLREFELKQIPQWPKGVGSARLREALDDLIEIYRKLSLK